MLRSHRYSCYFVSLGICLSWYLYLENISHFPFPFPFFLVLIT